MHKDGNILNGTVASLTEWGKIILEGNPHRIDGDFDRGEQKYWMKGRFICEEAVQGRADESICDGCAQKCGVRPLTVTFYEGKNQNVIFSMKHQGTMQIKSAYIRKAYGVADSENEIYTVTEYVEGKRVMDFCRDIGEILNTEQRRPVNEREKVLIKYRLMCQMLYAIRDYRKYIKKEGLGVRIELRPECFLVVKGEKWKDYQIKLTGFEVYSDHKNDNSRINQTLGELFSGMLEEEISRKQKKGLEDGELQQLIYMINRMKSMEYPWDSIEEMVVYMENFLDEWVKSSEIQMLKSPELLKKQEKEFSIPPYIQVDLLIEFEGMRPFHQFYEIPQGGIIMLEYGANIPGWQEDDTEEPLVDVIGYLYEADGKACFFSLWKEDDWKQILEINDKILFKDCSLEVKAVQAVGYSKKVQRRRRSIDLM